MAPINASPPKKMIHSREMARKIVPMIPNTIPAIAMPRSDSAPAPLLMVASSCWPMYQAMGPVNGQQIIPMIPNTNDVVARFIRLDPFPFFGLNPSFPKDRVSVAMVPEAVKGLERRIKRFHAEAQRRRDAEEREEREEEIEARERARKFSRNLTKVFRVLLRGLPPLSQPCTSLPRCDNGVLIFREIEA